MLMGLWGKETTWHVEKRLPDIPEEPLPFNELEARALHESLDLSSARQRMVVAGEAFSVSRATALLPDASLGARGEREDGAWKVGPILEFPIPLFDQGQARTGRSGAELRRAEQEYYALGVRIRAVVSMVRERLQGAEDRARYYRDILLPLQERIVSESQLHYNAMQLGIADLLRAREQQIQAAMTYVETLRDYWLARTELGQLLSGRIPSQDMGMDRREQRSPRRANAGH
jgi:outer membrane protein, heavy metal efflux system